MKRVICSRLPGPGKPSLLEDLEARHLTRVLRLEDGARVQAIDGSGRAVIATLRIRSGKAWLEFDEAVDQGEGGVGGRDVILEVAVLKSDAMEWMIEKAV